MHMSLSKLQDIVKDKEAWSADQATEQQQQQPEECLLISLGCISGWVLWSEILTSKVIVFESGAFGRWLGPEGQDLMNAISALIKETLESSLVPSAMWGHSEKTSYL